jgi:hypothetical protein
MRCARRILIVILSIIIFLGILAVAARRYLASRHVAEQVATRLRAVYGGHVQVRELSVGLASTSVHGLELFEEDADASAAPWAVVEKVQTDLSPWDLIRGEMVPHQLTLIDATVTLRFDRAGHLLTRLPSGRGGTEGVLPALRIERSQLTLAQEGHPDMVITGVTGDLHSEGDRVVLAGTVNNESWGRWEINGSVDRKDGATSADLKSAGRIHVTKEMLESLPFIPPVVWQEVVAEGNTPVELTVRTAAAGHEFYYRVALELDATMVDVKSIDLKANQVSGKLIIEDGVVQLQDVSGHTAGGEISTSADLDFSKAVSRLKFDVRANDLIVEELPRGWGLPPNLKGRLSGDADLLVTIDAGQTSTSGQGQGVIRNASVGGFPAEPIELKLRPRGKGYNFDVPKPISRRPQPIPGPALCLAPSLAGTDAARDIPQAFLAPPPEAPPRPAAASPEPYYLDVNLSLKDVDLAQLVKQLELEFPFPVTGRLSIQVQLSMPVNTPRDVKSYRLKGSATIPHLVLAGVEMDNVQAHVSYADGVLRLDELSGRVPSQARAGTGPPLAGQFRGTGRIELIPRGALTADLKLDAIPLARVMTLVPGAAERASGTISGSVTARTSISQLADITAWTVSGKITAECAQACGLALENGSASIRLERGVASTRDLRLVIEGAPVTGSGELHLTEPFRYQAELGLKDGDLAALQHLAAEFRPPVPLEGRVGITAEVHGTLSPLRLEASGTGTASIFKVNMLQVRSLKFRWDSDAQRIRIRDLRADLYGGELTGSAQVPLRAAATGSVDMRFDRLDAGALAKAIPGLALRLEGRAAGKIEGKLGIARPGQEREFTGSTELESPSLQVQGIPTERLHGTIAYRKGIITYRFEGGALGGRFHIDGRYPPAKSQPAPSRPQGRPGARPAALGLFRESLAGGESLPRDAAFFRLPEPGGSVAVSPDATGTSSLATRSWATPPTLPPTPQKVAVWQSAPRPWPQALTRLQANGDSPAARAVAGQPVPQPDGRLRLEGAQLPRIWDWLGVGETLRPLRGALDLEIAYSLAEPDRVPIGDGRFVLRRLRWQTTDLADTIQGDAILTAQQLRFRNITGAVAGGVVDGRIAFPLQQAGRGGYSLSLNGAEAAQLLAPWPSFGSAVQGPLDLRVRGRLGQEWTGAGEVSLVRGKVLGLEVASLRLPLDFAVVPSRGYGQVEVRDTSAQLALGRVTFRGSLSLGPSTHLEGHARFLNVDLRGLLRQAGDLGQMGAGQLSGRLDFSGSDVRSLNDVTATLNATLAQTQALQFPVLGQLVPYIAPGQSTTATFQRGDVRARLAGGIIRIERLTLSGTTLRLIIEGTMTLEGRLGLEVTAATGVIGIDPNTIRLLGLRLPAVGPIPVTLILRTSSYLSNRVVHLRVSGTVRSPSVQVEPVSLLTQEAVRFFLSAAGVPVAVTGGLE